MLEPVSPVFLCHLVGGGGGGGGIWLCPSAVRGSKGGREELKHESKMLTATPPPPYLQVYSLCWNQFLFCFFVIWGQLGGFGIILSSRSA